MDRLIDEERAYFRRRLAQHLAVARQSADAAARELHARFAKAYARRLAEMVDQD